MDPKHKKILQTSWTYLVNGLHNVERICDHLCQSEILTSGMIDRIKQKKPVPHDQTRELLYTLRTRGKPAYEAFLTALDETENKEIADHLRQKEGRPVNMVKAKKDEFKDHASSEKVDIKETQPIQVSSNQTQEKDQGPPPTKQTQDIVQGPDDKTKLTEQTSAEKENVTGYQWPCLKKGVSFRKKDLIQTSPEKFDEIRGRDDQIYEMAKGKKKGKVIWIVNTACSNTEPGTGADRCRENIDVDISSMDIMLKGSGFHSQDRIKNKTAEEIQTFLKGRMEAVDKDLEADYDSLVVIIFSGKTNCDAGKMYDIEGKEIVVEEEITKIICESEYFKGKPKIVMIQSYNFKDCVPFDNLDAKAENSMTIYQNCEKNNDDLFVVSTIPRIEQGPWMIGENVIGSYFIQAFIHVFKNHAHDKSFLEILQEVHNHLLTVTVPKKNKEGEFTEETSTEHVADVVVTKRGQKNLYFFPGYTGSLSDTGSTVCAPSDNPTNIPPVSETGSMVCAPSDN